MNANNTYKQGQWQDEINVRDFIQLNYSPYEGNAAFLEGASDATLQLWQELCRLMVQEREHGILDAETRHPASIASYDAGYIIKDLEKIVGLQTDKPLKRAIMPQGGLKMVQDGLAAYGYELDDHTAEIFTKYRKTHNQGVFDAYTPEMRNARKSGIITGLPDAYGRGRIIGDYRRVALYGTDRLIQDRKAIVKLTNKVTMNEETIREREETADQIRALQELHKMALAYGCDISKPAQNAREAIQWTYFAYLGAVKEQNGAAMSLGRVSTFLDIYIEHDLAMGLITEKEAQEYIDQFVMKLRIVRFLRTPDYDALFSGDPTWVTESIGGVGEDGRHLVTKTSFRFLHTLINLGPAPEPNLTVLWSEALPEEFKKYCAQVSITTSSIQYENDEVMRPLWGDDYAIACCVSAMRVGKQMQFFGARANLAKAMLYAINGGRDEVSGDYVGPQFEPITGDYLEYDELIEKYEKVQDWLANLYVNTLNVIHYMHDKYAYERLLMALHDRKILRTMACGIAGLSVAADSLSAVKFAKVKVIRDERGLAVDFQTEGEYPTYGNDDARVDEIAQHLVQNFMGKLSRQYCYRGAMPTQSVLTITSNVVYGKKTGTTPDGRKAGEPFAPGANPMHGRDTCGAIASMHSITRLPYGCSQDGISYTFSIIPDALGRTPDDRVQNLISLLDGYSHNMGHHINVNVFNRETLQDAMQHPEKYPQLTVRVSGYAVNFVRLTPEQQREVIARTFHEKI